MSALSQAARIGMGRRALQQQQQLARARESRERLCKPVRPPATRELRHWAKVALRARGRAVSHLVQSGQGGASLGKESAEAGIALSVT
jgi:hypothetical protein